MDHAAAPSFFARLRAIVGDKGLLTDAADVDPYLVEQRGRYRGATAAVARPASSEEVAEVVRAAIAHNVAIVPQGGNTGLVGGAVPDPAGGQILVNLGRMNRIRRLDPIDDTITVEAGCILKDIQDAAATAGRLFPLSLGAEGSCQIGGNLSTNAGGTAVLRYGNVRDLVLGLEVVLPDGRIWNGLRALRKDNTGYALRHLFVGAEGTLGIITAATLKLFSKPASRETALVALPSLPSAVEFLSRLRNAAGEALTGFEYMNALSLNMVLAHIPGTRHPLAANPTHAGFAHYAVIELTSPDPAAGLRARIEAVLEAAAEAGLILDAALSQSLAQAERIWQLRESIPEAQKPEGASIKNDVSVPVSAVPEFVGQTTDAVTRRLPGIRVVAFGHLGDGNIHFNLSQPPGADPAEFLARWDEFVQLVDESAVAFGGSFSAEHGIGLMKRAQLRRYRSAVEIDLMARIKAALDPENRMNPGKLL